MALNDPLPSTQVVVKPKAKKKYKTKKEKDVALEELVIADQTMVGGELCDEEAQNLKGGSGITYSTKI
jgi:hypothetical protein